MASGIVHTGLFSRRDCSSKRERVQRRSGQRGRWAFVVGLLVEEGASPKEWPASLLGFVVGPLVIEGASPKGMASVVAGLCRRRTTDELL